MNIVRFIKSFFSSDIAIDLGSENTKIYVKEQGIVLNEPTITALKHFHGEKVFIKYGSEAKEKLGKSPKNIEIVCPIKKGSIADLEATEALVEEFIARVHDGGFFRPSPTVLVAIPSSSSKIETKAIQDAIYNAGAKEVLFVKQGIAAALGCNVDISSTKPSCFIDIGAETTEVSVIASSGVVFSKTFDVGGKDMSNAIEKHILDTYKVKIGSESAERIKREMATVVTDDIDENVSMTVKCKNVLTDKPESIEIKQKDVYLGMYDPMLRIIEAIDEILKELSAETIASLFDNGIYVIGGSSQIKGLPELISSYTGLETHIVNKPSLSVIAGCGEIIEQNASFDDYDDY